MCLFFPAFVFTVIKLCKAFQEKIFVSSLEHLYIWEGNTFSFCYLFCFWPSRLHLVTLSYLFFSLPPGLSSPISFSEQREHKNKTSEKIKIKSHKAGEHDIAYLLHLLSCRQTKTAGTVKYLDFRVIKLMTFSNCLIFQS